MRAIGKSKPRPGHGAAEAAVEDNAVGYPIGAISGDGKAATRGESGRRASQAAAGQRAGAEGHRSQITCDQSITVETIDANEGRTGETQASTGAGESATAITEIDATTGKGCHRQGQS
ncbi:MAG: hypothetical protein AUH15_11940 [Acidobacteriales bacterium 13_2_20CM_55_8]|nr:MAG: hypothetical protein AUH15_11940 [Acidobacteriales bacterium 13_2_20CM_55_8]